jgi:hypothetical protein
MRADAEIMVDRVVVQAEAGMKIDLLGFCRAAAADRSKPMGWEADV